MKCLSKIVEECALKCTDQIPPHLNFCTPSKIESGKTKHPDIYSRHTDSSLVEIALTGITSTLRIS